MSSNLLADLEAVCASLNSALEDNEVYDDTLCAVLEDLLLDGLSCECDELWWLLKTVSHHSHNDFLENMENLSSHAGFIRGWVRVMLNDGAICSALKLLSEDGGVTQYYSDISFICQKHSVTAACNLLKSLDKHELNFVCNTVVLNQWRKDSLPDSLPDDASLAPSSISSEQCDRSPGFTRRYSVGNRIDVTGDEDMEGSGEQPGTNSTSSSSELRNGLVEQRRISLSDSWFSENPTIRWQNSNSQCDLRMYAQNVNSECQNVNSECQNVSAEYWALSDLTNLPEEGSVMSLTCDTEERLQYFSKIRSELGLSSQDFQCFSCSSSIGNQGQEFKVCNYDKRYYCRGCFANYTHVIPCKIIYNWDHNKYRVSKKSYDFLAQIRGLPNLDISKLNVSLYNHVPELAKVRDYRRILNMTREYLVRCNSKDDVSYDFIRKKLGTLQYFWDTPHLYSISDLIRSFTGQLQSYLKKLTQKCVHHVYCCKKCSSLGFICEYCQNPKIIFAFELHTTDQCAGCSAVYHKSCKRNAPCPKCIRKEQILGRHRPSPTDLVLPA